MPKVIKLEQKPKLRPLTEAEEQLEHIRKLKSTIALMESASHGTLERICVLLASELTGPTVPYVGEHRAKMDALEILGSYFKQPK